MAHEMTGYEFKAIEGQRLQQVMGAIGALPAAMLVFGDAPETSAAGAPLFLLAIALSVGALMCMNYTDSAFWLDSHERNLPDEHLSTWVKLEEDNEQFGHSVRTWSLFYGIGSLIVSGIGVAAVYSPLSISISVAAGFIISICLTILICFHIFWFSSKLQTLVIRSRDLSVHETSK